MVVEYEVKYFGQELKIKLWWVIDRKALTCDIVIVRKAPTCDFDCDCDCDVIVIVT